MLERLLAADTATELFGDVRRPGRVAVVRGFDVGSREFRGAIGELANANGQSVLDLPSAPAFGAVPAAEDVRLVVVARSSQLSLAERCAAFWGAPVLGPAVANSLGPVVLRPAPGLQVSVSDRAADGVAARLAMSGPVRYRIGGGPLVTAGAFAVEPSSAGVLVHSTADGEETLRVVERPMESVSSGKPRPCWTGTRYCCRPGSI